jgi:hypothetical protein
MAGVVSPVHGRGDFRPHAPKESTAMSTERHEDCAGLTFGIAFAFGLALAAGVLVAVAMAGRATA